MRQNDPPPRILGDKHNRRYTDCIGKPLAVGDTITYATAASSSVNVNFGVIVEFVDLKEPAYVGFEPASGHRYGRRIESWDKAFKLRIRRIECPDPEFPDEFTPERKFEKDPVTGEYAYVIPPLDDVRKQMIQKVDRVFKIDVTLTDG